MIEVSDLTLKRVISGDLKAFRMLYNHYASYIWAVIYRMVNGDNDNAEQIMQNIFIKLYKTVHSFKYESAFSTWLYRIVYNESLNFIKNNKITKERCVSYTDSAVPFSQKYNSYEDKEYVVRILNTLTSEERFLLIAREVNAVSFEELAGICGKTAGALRTMIHRIKENIRKEFEYEYTG